MRIVRVYCTLYSTVNICNTITSPLGNKIAFLIWWYYAHYSEDNVRKQLFTVYYFALLTGWKGETMFVSMSKLKSSWHWPLESTCTIYFLRHVLIFAYKNCFSWKNTYTECYENTSNNSASNGSNLQYTHPKNDPSSWKTESRARLQCWGYIPITTKHVTYVSSEYLYVNLFTCRLIKRSFTTKNLI